MFSIGSYIVYPMYGAGQIVDIEEKIIDGKTQKYYVINISMGNLNISVSVDSSEKMGLRDIYSKEKLLDIFENMSLEVVENTENWNVRYRQNLDNIKTGDFSKVLNVYKELFIREHGRSLSSAEKKLLSTSKQIILSEIILVFGIDRSQAEEKLSSKIDMCINYLKA